MALPQSQKITSGNPHDTALLPTLSTLGTLTSKALRRPLCALERSSAQSIASAGPVAIEFTTEVLDTENAFDSGASTTDITPQITGLWIITAYVRFQSNSSGYRRILLNVDGSFVTIDQRPAVSGDSTRMTARTVLPLLGSSVVNLSVDQNSGSTLSVDNVRFMLAFASQKE